MPPAPRPARPLLALDLLRFLCAVSVVTYHYLGAAAHSPSPHAKLALSGVAVPTGAIAATWWGWVGVEIFFVISGYVIACSARGATWSGFLRRRALRLYPAALVCASVSLAVLLAGAVAPAGRLFAEWSVSAALLPAGAPVDGSYWTLPIEIAFYLLIAGMLALPVRGERILEASGWGLGLVSTAVLLFGPPLGWTEGALHVVAQLLIYGPEFALGMALADSHGAASQSPLRLLWVAVLAAMTLGTTWVSAVEGAVRIGAPMQPWVPTLIVAIGLGILIAAPRLQPGLERLRGARHIPMLGLMTYPLYLVHQDAGLTIAAALVRRGVSYGAAVAVSAALALAFAWVVAARVEPAVRGWLAALDLRRFRAPVPDSFRNAFPPAG
ncbi:Peptidoglycan/LPS O-acetylase OafA/YrhL, contains acyltransferase and SGNH-hydrolase domains [Sphingomonas gellani]|uniref:Peptidoglycan/LPS O-acetylase OafA/YrhL, contains acyltransferase and SGNH-hydrolase domains n=1 Tax=Sphingomonas gellani TaxID=1166340 RepID=A0A1H8BFI7_9SPHN|nr:acyltransferase [Sphingomonas gellani]SEM80627.1 Peptidoglycan/LPS O-acetylase OafA/YrhL, contains acyltransferase and SGNH-hydrolase domains [Sphingomonas gellani]